MMILEAASKSLEAMDKMVAAATMDVGVMGLAFVVFGVSLGTAGFRIR